MKLLKILSSVTGKKYRLRNVANSPETLKIDSLTFIELVCRIEEELHLKIDGACLVELYHMKLLYWKKALKRG